MGLQRCHRRWHSSSNHLKAQTGDCPVAQIHEHDPFSKRDRGWEVGKDNAQSELVTVRDEGNARVHKQTQSCHWDSYFHKGFALRWEEIGRKSKNKIAESLTSFYSPSVIPYTRCSWMRKNSVIILDINYERWSAVTYWQYPRLYRIALEVHHICIETLKN